MPIFAKQSGAVGLGYVRSRGSKPARPLSKIRDASATVYPFRQHEADLALQRALVRPGLDLELLDYPIVEVADGEVPHVLIQSVAASKMLA